MGAAMAPCSGFHTALVPAAVARGVVRSASPRGGAAARRGGVRAAGFSLRMNISAEQIAAAEERAKIREAVIEEKRRQRAEREREARDEAR